MRPDGMLQNLVDQAVRECRRRLSDRLHSVYLLGSHADGTAIALSDIDLFLLLEEASLMTLRMAANIESTVHHDHPRFDSILYSTVTGLGCPGWRRWAPAVKYGSLLIYGSDGRDAIELPDTVHYLEDAVREFRGMVERIHSANVGPPSGDRAELAQCDGYVQPAPSWTGVDQWTHNLTTIIARGAGLFAATDSGRAPVSRADAHALFFEHGPSVWRELVAAVDRDCRSRWEYCLPDDRNDLATLVAYCKAAPDFEQDCLTYVNGWLTDRGRSAS